MNFVANPVGVVNPAPANIAGKTPRLTRTDPRTLHSSPPPSLLYRSGFPKQLKRRRAMAVTPALMVGAGTGAQSGECSDGRGCPSAGFPGSPPTDAANVHHTDRDSGSVRPNSEKSLAHRRLLLHQVGLAEPTLSAPISRSVNCGSLYSAGVNSSVTLTSGRRSSGSPPPALVPAQCV